MAKRMSLEELARCLFKPHWADSTEFLAAFSQFARLNQNDFRIVQRLGERYLEERKANQ